MKGKQKGAASVNKGEARAYGSLLSFQVSDLVLFSGGLEGVQWILEQLSWVGGYESH